MVKLQDVTGHLLSGTVPCNVPGCVPLIKFFAGVLVTTTPHCNVPLNYPLLPHPSTVYTPVYQGHPWGRAVQHVATPKPASPNKEIVLIISQVPNSIVYIADSGPQKGFLFTVLIIKITLHEAKPSFLGSQISRHLWRQGPLKKSSNTNLRYQGKQVIVSWIGQYIRFNHSFDD